MTPLQGSAWSQKQQESHEPLPLQSLDHEQYVKLDEGKRGIWISWCSRSQFFGCKVLHCYMVFQKFFWKLPNCLKQPNKPAPALMHKEASLAQKYHKTGMKNSPATRPDCVFGTEWGQPQEKALLPPALGSVFLLLFFCLPHPFFPDMEWSCHGSVFSTSSTGWHVHLPALRLLCCQWHMPALPGCFWSHLRRMGVW